MKHNLSSHFLLHIAACCVPFCLCAVGANVGRIAYMFDICSALRKVGDIGGGGNMAYNDAVLLLLAE